MAAMIRCGLGLALLFLVSGPIGADIIKLKDGREFEGKVIEQDDQKIKLKTPLGSLTLKKDDIAEIIEQKSVVDLMDERLLGLDPSQPSKYLEAGKWVIEEAKQEGVGLRLVNLAMALDPRLYADGQLYLGDYYYGKKNDRKKAAECYQRALLADPTNPACNERYDKVKDTVKDSGSACDQRLVDGLRSVLAGAFEQAQDELESGRNSVMRRRAEEMLGGPLQDVIDYCVSKTGCKACKGARTLQCSGCKGSGKRDCNTCGGKGYLVRKGIKKEEGRLCGECGGWLYTLCPTCKATRNVTPTVPPSELEPRAVGHTEPMVPKRLTDPHTWIPTNSVEGGTTPCRICSGKTAREVGPPDTFKLQNACAALDRQVKGQLTLWEQSLTRMPRVGGPGQIDDATTLLSQPVWWNGQFVAVETRRAADPNFGKGSGAAVADLESVRKGARALVPGSEAPNQFETTIRRTLGLGAATVSSQKQVYYTDFAPLASGGSASGTGPSVEVTDGGRRLRPCLVEIKEEFSARRIELDGGDGKGLALEGALEGGAWATSGAVVRLFYTVVDSKEVVTPGKDRDTVVTRLVAKVTLVDVLDSTGKVVQSAK